MGKLYDALVRQQKEHPNTEVFDIYELCKDAEGRVWGSTWQTLTIAYYSGMGSRPWYEPSALWHKLKDHFSGGRELKFMETLREKQ